MSISKNANQDNDIILVDLPNSNTVLVLGIFSIFSCFILGLPGLVMGIVALKLYKKPYELYQLAPELYKKESYKNLRVGYITSIIGIVLSSLFLLILIFSILIFGSLAAIL
ncbi:MAG: CCC motif membrane protein [Bacteroidota bacterium]